MQRREFAGSARRRFAGVTHAPSLVLVTGLPGTGKSTVASVAADALQTSVLAHDWAMSGLRGYPSIQNALDGIELGHRVVGWSILAALARAQLVEGRSIVVDGVARAPQRALLSDVATATGAAFAVITTHCSDADLHRSRIEGRRRFIPNWYELPWDDVERNMSQWLHEPGDLDLDAVDPLEQHESRIHALLVRNRGADRFRNGPSRMSPPVTTPGKLS